MWRDLSNERKDLREKTEVLKGEGILPPGWQPWLSSLLTYGFRTCRPPPMGEPIPPGKPLQASLLSLFSRWVVSDSFATPGTAARQAPLSTGFPRQEHWSGLPFPPPGDVPDPGIEPASPVQAGRFLTTEPLGKLFASTTFISLMSYVVLKSVPSPLSLLATTFVLILIISLHR